MSSSSTGLAQALREQNIIGPQEAEGLLEREQAERQPLASILLREGRISEKQLMRAHARALGLPFVDFETTEVMPEAMALVPPEVVRRTSALPFHVDATGLYVAIADPRNTKAALEMGNLAGQRVQPVLASPGELDAMLARFGDREQELRPAQQHAADDWLATPVAPAAMPVVAGNDSDHDVIQLPEIHEADEAGGRDQTPPVFDLHVNDLLQLVVEAGASDLHLSAGTHPQMRLHGDLSKMTDFPVLDGVELRRMLYAIMTQKQREKFESVWELDFSHPLPGIARFRVNIFLQRGSIGAVMRTIPNEIVPLDRLGVPRIVREFADYPRGLVLVTGPTGSGKSTTLASLVDIVNTERPVHIMTVEDPIEFLHRHKKALVNQREVGEDTKGFGPALKHVLRQDPDVILVGELRDLETIQTALTAAETGHLVYATLHTQDAPQSIDRMIDVFPPHQQQQVRVMLATCIQAIMTQQLIKTADGRARHVACEVMIATPAIRNLIREGKIYQIYSSMQAGGQYGMQTMDQSLADLVKYGKISYELAMDRCGNQSDLARLCGRM